MAPLKPATLPLIRSLPSSDAYFVQAIDDVTLLAGGLIAAVDATMLAIAVPSDRWSSDIPVVAWTPRLTSCPLLARTLVEEPMFGPAFDALCIAADALFARLETWHWDAADAPGLCLVTDGVGVVLSVGRPPADAGCGWLLDLAQAQGDAITVRPPDDTGLWSLIAAESQTLH